MQQMCRNMKQNCVLFSENILAFALTVCLRLFAVVCVRNTQIQRIWKVRIMTGLKQTQRFIYLFIAFFVKFFFFLINSFFLPGLGGFQEIWAISLS